MTARDKALAHVNAAATELNNLTVLLTELGRSHHGFVDEVRSLYNLRADLYRFEERLCSLPHQRFGKDK